ncbi:MAG: UDP-N-acetylmuramate--L-alanine ligase [Candidatus Omnitrophica bacterium]|nr:UDP-N-acetylmuramate--L-alanine ligase [Candidatus Omnitrophota bacterium]
MYKYVHFIGIGGIGMSGLAHLLLREGIKVSGSDIKDSEVLDNLRNLGAKIYIGHHPSHIENQDLVICSSAIKEDNPEFKEAIRKNIRVIKRAQALAELTEGKTVVSVTGSHGKSTTSTFVAHLLLEAGLSPTVAVGGISFNWNNNAYLGDGNFFIIEADESDGSFIYYQPDYSIITNIDYEHLDYYKSFDRLLDAFKDFIENTKFQGCVIGCKDDYFVESLLNKTNRKVFFYGLNKNPYIYAENIILKDLSSQFDCIYKGKFLERFELYLGGLHNVSNTLAVIALGMELGIELPIIKKAVATFRGVRRRMEVKFKDANFTVLDDYAHHPTEIKATLKAISELKKKRMLVVFQPHRYTRTKLLLDEFAKSFDLADELIITDIYPADEEPIPGIDSSKLYQRLIMYGYSKVKFLPKDKIREYILGNIRKGDLIISLGAGDIYKITDELVKELKRRCKI